MVWGRGFCLTWAGFEGIVILMSVCGGCAKGVVWVSKKNHKLGGLLAVSASSLLGVRKRAEGIFVCGRGGELGWGVSLLQLRWLRAEMVSFCVKGITAGTFSC